MDQSTIDNLSAQRFIHYIITPFNQWEAHQRGIIDSSGKVISAPKNSQDAVYYNMFHVLVTKIKDLISTSGKGTSWVTPSSAGSFYLGNKNLPAANFTNWSVSNRAGLPSYSAAYSSMKECVKLDDDELFESFYNHFFITQNESDLEEMESVLVEDGNFASQVVGVQMPLGEPSPLTKKKPLSYKAQNEKESVPNPIVAALLRRK